jgi:hypothetical protein
MLIRTEDGASLESESLGIWRVMPAASPLRGGPQGQGRALRPMTPTGWLVVANRLGSSGASLVCLASCAHRADARQLLDALLLARRHDAASFDLGALRYSYTKPCPQMRASYPAPSRDWPFLSPQVLGGGA